jgi:SAM-dependent methyltransferase
MQSNCQVKKIAKCRVCAKNNFTKVFNFGPTPLANEFLKKEQLDLSEDFYPLEVYRCNNCFFLELGHVVNPKILFGNYVYVSSTSQVFKDHFNKFARDVYSQFHLDSNSLVIDIGSNDGILLKPFKRMGVKVLGIEPATQIADVAKKEGIDTEAKFFNVELAKKIVKKKGHTDVVSATNVFAHIDDLDEVINGLKILLKEEGIFIIEAPYLVDFIKKKYFDLVYHEHLSYWSVDSLIKLFKRFDMEVFDVKKVPVHGGSIRVFVKRLTASHEKTSRVKRFLDLENSMKLKDISTYSTYVKGVYANRAKLVSLLTRLKLENKKIAAYGAPAKGNTLLNFFGIGPELIDYVVDDSQWKQGLYTPGKRIPVVSSRSIYEDSPDYLLILAWNFADSIMKNHSKYKQNGGKFIIPVPKPKII